MGEGGSRSSFFNQVQRCLDVDEIKVDVKNLDYTLKNQQLVLH